MAGKWTSNMQNIMGWLFGGLFFAAIIGVIVWQTIKNGGLPSHTTHEDKGNQRITLVMICANDGCDKLSTELQQIRATIQNDKMVSGSGTKISIVEITIEGYDDNIYVKSNDPEYIRYMGGRSSTNIPKRYSRDEQKIIDMASRSSMLPMIGLAYNNWEFVSDLFNNIKNSDGGNMIQLNDKGKLDVNIDNSITYNAFVDIIKRY